MSNPAQYCHSECGTLLEMVSGGVRTSLESPELKQGHMRIHKHLGSLVSGGPDFAQTLPVHTARSMVLTSQSR